MHHTYVVETSCIILIGINQEVSPPEHDQAAVCRVFRVSVGNTATLLLHCRVMQLNHHIMRRNRIPVLLEIFMLI